MLRLIIATLLTTSLSLSSGFFPPDWPDVPLDPQGKGIEIAGVTVGLSAQECGRCHTKQYEGWKESMHARSSTNPLHKAVLKSQGEMFCSGCHLPLLEQLPTLTQHGEEGKPNPLYQASLVKEGVTCVVCHLRDGMIYGPGRGGPAPHPTKPSPLHQQADFCAACHQSPTSTTYEEWKESAYGQKGVVCQTCHMPDGEHTWPGGHHPEMVRQAATVSVQTDQEIYQPGEIVQVTVEIHNVGAGHNFPTGCVGKNGSYLLLTTTLMDNEKKILTQRREVMTAITKTPQCFPVPIIEDDTRIRPGEKRRYTYTWSIPEYPNGAIALQVELVYALFYPTPDLEPFLDREQFRPIVLFSEKKLILQR